VGTSTLSIIDSDKKNFQPFIFTANKNYKLICNQIKKYQPKIFLISDYNTFLKVFKKFKKSKTKIINNINKINSKSKSDIAVTAIPGIAGLEPTMKMVTSSKKVLIANKESIICGWDLIFNKAKKNKTELIPVDSEHYSILKLLENKKKNIIKKIYLTASGGPFLNYTSKRLRRVKPSQALKHPKWKMGKKISIDSATLMNKIFELIEAQKLFNLSSDKIDIIIHPNSLVHAILELKNGLKQFIYHETSMKIPIANALYDGDIDIRKIFSIKKKVDFEDLIFKKVNKRIFPAIILKKKLNQYPSAPIIVNAANEILVDQFLRGKIAFLDIIKIILTILKDNNYKKYAIKKPKNLNQINLIDLWARAKTLNKLKNKYDV
jgi:1-deoxy-D-xylulose-5-phosphate reductoisomerase